MKNKNKVNAVTFGIYVNAAISSIMKRDISRKEKNPTVSKRAIHSHIIVDGERFDSCFFSFWEGETRFAGKHTYPKLHTMQRFIAAVLLGIRFSMRD